jgi:hypothetical protein
MRKEPPPYVSKADGNEIIVKASPASSAHGFLTGLGFTPQSGSADSYLLSVKDEREKARIFSTLRDADICFSRGREWNPAEVFEWLRDQGLLSGPFKSIAWKGPDDWFLKDEI